MIRVRTGVIDKAFPAHRGSAWSVSHGVLMKMEEEERIYLGFCGWQTDQMRHMEMLNLTSLLDERRAIRMCHNQGTSYATHK